jgi:DNA-binding transcriptional LysR family regulator
MVDWNDLKFLLHVMRAGSTLSASRTLGASQSTVMRRIQALETALGLELFEKRRSGYHPTDALTALMASLSTVELSISDFEQNAARIASGMAGKVRITSNEILVQYLLNPAIIEFRRHYPGIEVEVVSTEELLDLSSGEVDIALRSGDRPNQMELAGRKVYDEAWSLYCSPDYAAARGVPRSVEEFGAHDFISVFENLHAGPLSEWVENTIPKRNIVIRHSDIVSIYLSARNGNGITVCPDIPALADPGLVRCMPVDVRTGKEVWLLTDAMHRNVPRVRVVLDFLGSFLTRRVALLRAAADKDAT